MNLSSDIFAWHFSYSGLQQRFLFSIICRIDKMFDYFVNSIVWTARPKTRLSLLNLTWAGETASGI